MSRPLITAAIAGVAVLVGASMAVAPDPARAADPDAAPFLEAAADAGLSCDPPAEDGSGGTFWKCLSSDDVIHSPPYNLTVTAIQEGAGSFFVTVTNTRATVTEVSPADPEFLAYLDRLVTLALGDEPDAHAWLAEMNDGPSPQGSLVRGDWMLDWFADLSVYPGETEGSSDIRLHLNYYATASPPPTPAPTEGADQLEACDLLTEAEVEEVTGLDAQPGVTKEVWAGAVGCGFGTQPYELRLDVTTTAGEPAVDGLGTSGIAVDGLGDGAQWHYCEECVDSDFSWSTNSLVVADGSAYIHVLFHPITDEAGALTHLEQATHREWAVELARLILPRVAEALTVAPETPVPSQEQEESPATAPSDPLAGGGAPAAPFAASIPAPAEVSTDPIVVLQSAALAALLVFLMPFPSQLFNSTLETHEDEVKRWLRLDRIGSAVGGIGALWASWPGVAIFTLLAAVLYGFLDPGFGLDVGSLATFLGMLLGIVLVTAAFAVPVVLAHRRIGDRWSLKVVPVSLLIGVACVLLSRLTDFQPGYLYGLLIGLAFARELSNAEEGRATAIGAALMLSVAFGAWLALGALPDGEAFGLVVLRTSLAALMVAGLEGVVFGLLPMRFLPGEPLYAWNRVLWGALLLIGAFAFFHILINPASGYLSDSSRTPLFTVLAMLIGFSLVSVAFWAWFRFWASSPAGAA